MSRRYIIFSLCFAVLFLMVLMVYQYFRFFDGKLHIVFCNVGQGDGIFIRTPKGVDILVDGGPDDSILSCLSNHMPFWDRRIELMILSHPHADHLNGLISVLKRYSITHFATERLANSSEGFAELTRQVKSHCDFPSPSLRAQAKQSFLMGLLRHFVPRNDNCRIHYVYKGDSFTTKDNVRISILGPSGNFLEETSPTGNIENHEFSSIVSQLSFGSFTAILTGDSQKEQLEDDISGIFGASILQAPHHGSKTGLSEKIVSRLNPSFAAISVGKKNKYGHPSSETLEILKDVKILRTDERGEVEIVTDGKVFWLAKK